MMSSLFIIFPSDLSISTRGNIARPWQVKDRLAWQTDQILSILAQSLEGLASLHNSPNPVLHRHIKPENILVAHYMLPMAPSAGAWFKLADFGLAREGTKCKDQAGTWLYTAPEVFFDGYDSPKVRSFRVYVSSLGPQFSLETCLESSLSLGVSQGSPCTLEQARLTLKS